MTATLLPPLATRTIQLSPGQGIAIYSKGNVRVSKLQGSPIFPNSLALIGTVSNQVFRFGPYVDGATIEISSDAIGGLYEIGTAPNVKEINYFLNLPIQPDLYDDTAIILASSVMRGVIICDPVAPIQLSLPAAQDLEMASQFDVFESFELTFINISANAVTILGDQPGSFVFGSGLIVANSSASFGVTKIQPGAFFSGRGR